jgi:hypothetical protein
VFVLGPQHPKGFYYVVYYSEFSFSPALPAGEKAWVRMGQDGVFSERRGRVFFFVPEGTDRFAMTVVGGEQTSGRRYLSSGHLFDPDLEPVQSLAVGRSTQPIVAEVDVKPQHRGKVWYLVAEEFLTVPRVTGIPPWIAGDFRAFQSEPRFPPEELLIPDIFHLGL